MAKNSTVDGFIQGIDKLWQKELVLTIRRTILECGLSESLKWGTPVYAHHGNVVGVGVFKQHVAVAFFEGALLKNEAKVLAAAQETTKSMRQWKFTETDRLDVNILRRYVQEAALNMEKGMKVARSKPLPVTEIVIPDLLQAAFDSDPELKDAYHSLAPGYRKEYAWYVADAKQEATRQRRLEKVITAIRERKGLNDAYKKH